MKEAHDLQRPLILRTTAYMPQTQGYIDEILEAFLAQAGMSPLRDNLQYCLRELGMNAKKANVKRVFFQKASLDIFDPEHYEEGMKRFKKEALSHPTAFVEELKEHGYQIKVELWRREDYCTLAVKNNALILDTEMQRVKEKILSAKLYQDREDALVDLVDETEGAGLGILVLIQMLKRLGCQGEYFKVYTHAGETVARIILPMRLALGACGD